MSARWTFWEKASFPFIRADGGLLAQMRLADEGGQSSTTWPALNLESGPSQDPGRPPCRFHTICPFVGLMKRVSKAIDGGLRSLEEAFDDVADTLFARETQSPDLHRNSTAGMSAEDLEAYYAKRFEEVLGGEDPEKVERMMRMFQQLAEQEELQLEESAKVELKQADAASTKSLLQRLKPRFVSRRKQGIAFSKVLTIDT